MALHYKFASAKDYNSIHLDGPFISVCELKQKIFESKYKSRNTSSSSRCKGLCLCRGTDFDLAVTNAQTNEDYHDDSILIAKNSSVLIRRVPGGRGGRNPIDVTPIVVVRDEDKKSFEKCLSMSCGSTVTTATGSSDIMAKDTASSFDFDDDLGGDVYAIPQAKMVPPSNVVTSKDNGEEHSGFGRTGRSHTSGFERKITPPDGYVCHRCNVSGHYIQHCPTNGDPSFDFRRHRHSSTAIVTLSIPRAVNTNASSAVSDPDRKVSGGLLPAKRPFNVGDNHHIPPELMCPLCKQVMKDAVISKCCFNSFCDKCIRDQLVSKSKCFCGSNTQKDHLIPNLTLRATINAILESKSGVMFKRAKESA